MSSYPCLNFLSRLVNLNNFGILFKKPLRRCVCRGTQNHIHIPLAEKLYGSVKPFKVKFFLLRFKSAPCKLCHSHNFNPGVIHHIRILNPKSLIPVLRIIIHTYIYTLRKIYNIIICHLYLTFLIFQFFNLQKLVSEFCCQFKIKFCRRCMHLFLNFCDKLIDFFFTHRLNVFNYIVTACFYLL